MPKLLDVIETANILGEAPHWNTADQCLWWTDIHARRLLRLDPATRIVDAIGMPERLGCFTFCEADPGALLAGFETGLAIHYPASGRTGWIARPEQGASGRRFNDGRADRQGRFWISTMVEDHTLAAPASAGLYCLDTNGDFTERETEVEIGNGLCFSPDGATMYFADSARQTIHAYALQPDTGQLSGKRLFAQVGHGAPDGAAVDSEGFIWSARWGAGCIVRHAPDGTVADTLAVPVSQPSCVAFGGPDLRLMFITSAREGMGPAALQADMRAGSLLIYESEIAGLPEPLYAGPVRLPPGKDA
jgi:sugar lactone lactonase YvrE